MTFKQKSCGGSSFNRRLLPAIRCAPCALLALSSATALAYPDKPVRVIVPQAAGSSFDSVVRLPDLPTLAEAGVPGVEITGWIGVMGPRGTPKSIINTLHTGIAAIVQMPDVKQRLIASGADPSGSTPQQFATFLKSETAKWAKVIKDAGLALSQ